MTTTLAAMLVAFATSSAASDGENANRVRASIYETVIANQTPRLAPAIPGDIRAQAPARRAAKPARTR